MIYEKDLYNVPRNKIGGNKKIRNRNINKRERENIHTCKNPSIIHAISSVLFYRYDVIWLRVCYCILYNNRLFFTFLIFKMRACIEHSGGMRFAPIKVMLPRWFRFGASERWEDSRRARIWESLHGNWITCRAAKWAAGDPVSFDDKLLATIRREICHYSFSRCWRGPGRETSSARSTSPTRSPKLALSPLKALSPAGAELFTIKYTRDVSHTRYFVFHGFPLVDFRVNIFSTKQKRGKT